MLQVDRRPDPIKVKAGWNEHAPPPGLLAFMRRYPKTRATFTISGTSREPLRRESTTHHFLALDEVPEILERVQ